MAFTEEDLKNLRAACTSLKKLAEGVRPKRKTDIHRLTLQLERLDHLAFAASHPVAVPVLAND